MMLVWDSSTNNQGGDHYVKAAYADGSESEEAKFNFCEASVLAKLGKRSTLKELVRQRRNNVH